MADWTPIYDTGTATVSAASTAVTGTGTSWATIGLRAGDQFRAQGLSVTIAAIGGNGALTLAHDWPGDALDGDDYEILRVSDADRVIAATAELLARLTPNLTALGQLIISADKLPYGSGPGALSLTTLTAFSRSLLAGANAGAWLTALGISGGGAAWDAQADDLTARAAYDDEDEGFAVLVSDTGDGRAAIYTMGDGGASDWSDPAYFTGPAGAAPLDFATSIYRPAGVAAGEYYLDRLASAGGTLTDLHAELIEGDEDGEVDVAILVDGVLAHGPVNVVYGTPITLDDIDVDVEAGQSVSLLVSYATGADARDLYVKAWG